MSCQHYSWNGVGIFGDYYCNKEKCKVSDDYYQKYCKGYNYSNCPNYKKSNSTGCFLTTIVCNILKKPDNDVVLDKMRNFRDTVLQKDEQYIEILKGYDTIGPVIANCMINDQDRDKLANGLYPILDDITKKIDNKEYAKAITNYQVMTLGLINYYGLKHTYNDLKDNNYYLEEYDQSSAGHGRQMIKSLNNVRL